VTLSAARNPVSVPVVSGLGSASPNVLLAGLCQDTVPRTQMRGKVSRANEISTGKPGATSSELLHDMPPLLSSWLLAIKFRFLPATTETSVITGMRT